jgi:HSP20 family molecular chaperone IbpA
VNSDEAKAILTDGELKLTLPKVEETKSKRIEVK